MSQFHFRDLVKEISDLTDRLNLYTGWENHFKTKLDA